MAAVRCGGGVGHVRRLPSDAGGGRVPTPIPSPPHLSTARQSRARKVQTPNRQSVLVIALGRSSRVLSI
ncbi:unnamed protein product [Pieris brassicae]|uniref:Uncharacterized protein n=1 Tax=Pieris brassicae TaxID=7116 RepID=A0A9P0TV39_PIEBR|nr:unnamed protein product [Pieris brassicae]